MQRFEYKVIPAPKRGERARGVKTTEDRFAYALTLVMNDLGAEGWEYIRADALPCEERVGLTGTKTTFQNMLVFRRALGSGAEEAPRVILRPAMAVTLPAASPEPAPAPRLGPAEAPLPVAAPAIGPARDHAAE